MNEPVCVCGNIQFEEKVFPSSIHNLVFAILNEVIAIGQKARPQDDRKVDILSAASQAQREGRISHWFLILSTAIMKEVL
jgi:hypothetical protein